MCFYVYMVLSCFIISQRTKGAQQELKEGNQEQNIAKKQQIEKYTGNVHGRVLAHVNFGR